MDLATTITGYSQQLVYASNINLSTNVITFSISNATAEYLSNIYKVVFKEITVGASLKPLPTNIVGNEVYFLRKINATTCKLYTTESDALAQTNAVDWTSENVASVSTYFAMYYISKKYTPILAVSTAAAPEDVFCCPPEEPRKVADLIDTATITFLDTTITLKMRHWNVDTYSWDYSRKAYFTAPEVTIGSYQYKFEMYFYDGPSPNYSEDYTQCRMSIASNDPDWGSFFPILTETENTSFLNADFPMSGNLEGERYVGTYPSGSYVATSIPVVFSGSQVLPDQLRFYMVDAYLERRERDLVDPIVAEGILNKVELGTIDVLLTYDTDAKAYISDVLNYYEIPGRLIFAPLGFGTYYPADYPSVTSGKKYITGLSFHDQYLSYAGLSSLAPYGIKLLYGRYNSYTSGNSGLGFKDFMISQDSLGGFTDFYLPVNHSFTTHYTGGDAFLTGLSDGALFMDTRFQYSTASIGRGWNLNGTSQKFELFFAMQKSARNPSPYDSLGYLYSARDIYKANFYYIISDSNQSYITSLIT